MSCSLLHSILSLSLLRSKKRLEICLFSDIIKIARCLRLGLEVRLLRKLKQWWIAPPQRLLSGMVKLRRELLRAQLFGLFAKLLLIVRPCRMRIMLRLFFLMILLLWLILFTGAARGVHSCQLIENKLSTS